MRINLETILTQANEKLPASYSAGDHEEQVEAFRSFLKVETERLRIRHRFGLPGSEIVAGRSYVIDLVVCRVCQLAASDLDLTEAELSGFAAVALGGYGRKELCPFSDIDILFLYSGRKSQFIKKLVEPVLYILWDAGLTVGHSFRSVSECVSIAKEDIVSRNAMSEARLITGSQELFRRFIRELDETVFKKKRETDAFVEEMKLQLNSRYEKFGSTVCLQEPNVKESAGGLRDLHSVLWVGHTRYGCRGLDDLRAQDHISGAEYGAARRAYDFVLRVRNEAHFATGRHTDLLTLDLQPTLAANLGYERRRGLQASELFMRDYYQRASQLHSFAEDFLARAFQVNRGGWKSALSRSTASKSKEKYVVKQGWLQPRGGLSDFEINPLKILEAFSVAQSEGVSLSTELKLAIRRSLPGIDRRIRESAAAGRAFVDLLRKPGRVAATLRSMHETGFLGRFLPEFGRITFLVQHDFYHRYTIDEHSLKTTEALDRLANGFAGETDRFAHADRFAKVLGEIKDTAPLYLGLLLHDIGKGHGGGHVAKGVRIAERVCSRVGLEQGAAQRVIFLVRQHLLMSHLSQRRDTTDEGLVEEFARTVRDLESLNLLLLLTYGDMSGVGPGVWNDWKASLLWDLYAGAKSVLAGGSTTRSDPDRREKLKQKVALLVLPEFLPSEVERHFAMMPERYLRVTDPDQIARQLRLVRQLDSQSLVTAWKIGADRHFTELTVCTRDSAGLFARIAGTLTASGLNILSADLNTREDGVVIDTFRVSEVGGHQPVKSDRWPKIEANLSDAIEGRLEVGEAVERWRAKVRRPRRRSTRPPVQPNVRFDSESSAVSTVVEVRAEDAPGLAYTISSTLSHLGLDITFAKIATDKNQALDVFYVTDSDGQKLLPTFMPAVEAALIEALGGTQNS
ncbi:MAG TPA: [protein-PII] uridylyltransferase [Blastocatellia bacterium]|nr:[protein-PII] uridylyltransferase [Blastocatellia bacterium]